jgi:hypothetical protein
MMKSFLVIWNKFKTRESQVAKATFFLLKTFFLYALLDYSFIAYTGITSPGGRLYSPILYEKADFIGEFRVFLLWGGAQFASFIGYPSGYTNYTLFIQGGSGVRMVYSCLGLSLMSAYVALVVAWPSPWLHNMIRLGGLTVLFSNGQYGYFKYINHHDLFNIIVLVVVFLMFTVHMKCSERVLKV